MRNEAKEWSLKVIGELGSVSAAALLLCAPLLAEPANGADIESLWRASDLDVEVASLTRAPQTVVELSSFGFDKDSANQVRIGLHGDQSVDVFIAERVHQKASVTLIGACEGAPPRSFVVTFSQETAAGHFSVPDGTAYDVLPLGGGRALLTSVTDAADDGCAVIPDKVEIHDAPLAATELRR